MSETNYYKILGIDKNSNETEIKKAYKKLAMKYHPDRNLNNKEEAEEKFKKINKAYNVLSDKKTRRNYDNFGEEGVKSTTGTGFNAYDIFNNIFTNMSGNESFFGMNFSGPKEEDFVDIIKMPIEITLLECYTGTTKTINLDVKKCCLSCNGTGCSDKNKVLVCDNCDGNRYVNKVQHLGSFQIMSHMVKCPKCNGTGEKPIPKNLICLECKGNKVISDKQKITLNIEKGMLDNNKIRKENIGNYNCRLKKRETIDFIINIKNNTFFKREGVNLVYTKDISIGSALCGINFAIKHLNGQLINIEYNKIIKEGDSLFSKDLGLPVYGNLGNRKWGDLIIRFNILYPRKIKEEYKKYLTKMLYVPVEQEACLEGDLLNKIKDNNSIKFNNIYVDKESIPSSSYSSSNTSNNNNSKTHYNNTKNQHSNSNYNSNNNSNYYNEYDFNNTNTSPECNTQ